VAADTLGNLAKRYPGDQSCYMDIFNTNTGKRSNPDQGRAAPADPDAMIWRRPLAAHHIEKDKTP
jgi:hypothetical protein